MDEQQNQYNEYKIRKAKKIFFSDYLIRCMCSAIKCINEWQDKFVSIKIHVSSKKKHDVEKSIAHMLNAINMMQEQGLIDSSNILKYVAEEHDKCDKAMNEFIARMLKISDDEFM